MTTPRLHASLPQQALALTLSVAVTSVVLAGLLALAGGEAPAHLAQQRLQTPQAVATPLGAPTA